MSRVETMGRQAAPRSDGDVTDTTSTSEGASTFTSISTPPIQGQLEQLAKEPPLLTQAEGAENEIKKGMFTRMRKPRGTVDIEHTFRHIFGKENFKGKQRDIMQAAISGMDILVIAPTGMGKSLCFQVPAVAEEHGLTIVITPLLSLMENQVQALTQLGVRAAMLTSRTPDEEKKQIEKDMQSGHPRNRLLYITPERLAMGRFRTLLKKVYKQGELARLVVDEAHCISEWGHSFRKEYQQIGKFREDFEKIPIMALTASATKSVQHDIILSLDMRLDRLYKVIHSFNRINLFYEVRYVQEGFVNKLNDISGFIHNLYRRKSRKNEDIQDPAEARCVSGIIYCRAKKTCDMVAEALRKKGINAAAFHRGLKDWEADKNAKMWRDAEALARAGKKRVDCIVATVAFGMGIDAPGCRYVIHFDLPTSFEGFYQETGRAGRDGHASRCVLYYSRQDAETVKVLVKRSKSNRTESSSVHDMEEQRKSSLDEFLKYAENVTECRHILICRYFGEKPKSDVKISYCDRFCDVCKNPTQTALSKKALDPPDLVATQMAQIEKEADEEWSGTEETPPSKKRSLSSREEEECVNDEQAEANEMGDQPAKPLSLPGFVKASEWRVSGRQEQLPETPLLDEEKATPVNMEIDEPTLKEQPTDTMQPAGDEPSEDPPTPPAPAPAWVPMRRPSKIVPAAAPEEPAQLAPQSSVLPTAPVPCPRVEREPPVVPNPPLPSSTHLPSAPVPPLRADRGRETHVKESVATKRLFNPQSVSHDEDSVEVVSKPPVQRPPAAASKVSPVKWRAPFRNGATRPGHVEELPDIGVDLPEVAADIKFTLSPEKWTKRIDCKLRRDAVSRLFALLCRVFLAKSGIRAKSEQAEVFEKLGTAKGSDDQHERYLLYSALQIEEDTFWQSITSAGFSAAIAGYMRSIKALSTTHAWLSTFPASNDPKNERIFAAMSRAIKYRYLHQKAQNRYDPSDSDDSDY